MEAGKTTQTTKTEPEPEPGPESKPEPIRPAQTPDTTSIWGNVLAQSIDGALHRIYFTYISTTWPGASWPGVQAKGGVACSPAANARTRTRVTTVVLHDDWISGQVQVQHSAVTVTVTVAAVLVCLVRAVVVPKMALAAMLVLAPYVSA